MPQHQKILKEEAWTPGGGKPILNVISHRFSQALLKFVVNVLDCKLNTEKCSNTNLVSYL